MVDLVGIPEKIKQDIAIYLSPEEKIIKALSAASGKTAGEVWLILTSRSIFFHTCEPEKEPVVALIGRNEIKEIDYFQKPAEIVLTFIPAKNQGNTTRLSFSIDKKDELEDFCDDIADLINFRMETASGVKIYPKPDEKLATPVKPAEKKPEPAKVEAAKAQPAAKPVVKPVPPQDVKIVAGESDNGVSPRYILFATLISLLVAFIWYQFFRAIADKPRK